MATSEGDRNESLAGCTIIRLGVVGDQLLLLIFLLTHRNFPDLNKLTILMMRQTILNCHNAEGCGRHLKDLEIGELLPNFHSMTFSGAVELFMLALSSSRDSALRNEIRIAAETGIKPWSLLVEAWSKSSRPVLDKPYAAIPFEFRRIVLSESDEEQIAANLFEQRFRKALELASFPSDFSLKMAKVFHEMIDNVLEHSRAANPAFRSQGLVGYQAVENYFSFSVADNGLGFLSSLKTSPEWRDLKTEDEALRSVIKNSASRRAGQGEGEGFKLVLKALADHGVLIRMRSADRAATVKATPSGRVAEFVEVPHFSGAHISVWCRLGSETKEEPYNFS